MDWLKEVRDKKAEFGPLHARHKKDNDLANIVPYVMMTPDGSLPQPGVINVTGNDAATSMNRANAILCGANIQTVVKGKELEDKATSLIEAFLNDFYLSLDERLINQGIPGLYPYLVNQINRRGWIGARCLVRMKGDKFIPDIAPWDMQNVVYERGVDGLNWAANITNRSKSKLESEYPELKDLREGNLEVIDILNGEEEIVFVDDKQVTLAKERKHKLGYVPVVISMSTSGVQLPGVSLQHDGESILASNRELYGEMNRCLSIAQTLNVAQFLGSLQYESEEGEGAEKPELPVFGLQKVFPVDKGGGYTPMPIQDLRRAALQLYAWLETRLQRGLFSALDMGTIMFPLSAVAITRMTAHQNEILIPGIQGLAVFYQALSKMIISQYIGGEIKADLGETGLQTKYGESDLKGDYSINYNFSATSPEQDIANLAQAKGARGILSDDTIRRNVLKLENPDEENDKLIAQMAKVDDEVLAKYDYCSSLIRQKKDIEAKLVQQSLLVILRQRMIPMPMQPQQPSARRQAQPSPEDLIPLLGETGGAAPKAGVFNPERESMRQEEPMLERGEPNV